MGGIRRKSRYFEVAGGKRVSYTYKSKVDGNFYGELKKQYFFDFRIVPKTENFVDEKKKIEGFKSLKMYQNPSHFQNFKIINLITNSIPTRIK